VARNFASRERASTVTAIDLFAGAGGVTAGLKLAGLRILAAVELDPATADSYRANHPEVTIMRVDIEAIKPEDVMDLVELAPGELTLLTACSPCQGHSSLGSQDPADPRNDLILSLKLFVVGLCPKAVAFENVPPLANDDRFAQLAAALDLPYVDHRSSRQFAEVTDGIRSAIVSR
jgi:DNA (cytosine-5)-methyltransferase 1